MPGASCLLQFLHLWASDLAKLTDLSPDLHTSCPTESESRRALGTTLAASSEGWAHLSQRMFHAWGLC